MENENTQNGQVQTTEPTGQQEEGNLEPTGELDVLEVDGQTIPVEEIDNLKSYKHFQSKYDHEKIETSKEREARIRAEERAKLLEEKLNSFTQPKEVSQEPKEPIMPEMPPDLDTSDFYDPSTVSGQWYKKKLQYDVEKDKYDRYWRQNIEKERQLTAEEKKREADFLATKNEYIAKFQQVPGVTLQEAMEAFDFINSEEVLNPEKIIAYKRFVKGQKPKQAVEQPGKIVPATTVTSAPATKANNEFVKNTDRSWMYKT